MKKENTEMARGKKRPEKRDLKYEKIKIRLPRRYTTVMYYILAVISQFKANILLVLLQFTWVLLIVFVLFCFYLWTDSEGEEDITAHRKPRRNAIRDSDSEEDTAADTGVQMAEALVLSASSEDDQEKGDTEKNKKSVQKTRRISRAPVDSEDSEPERETLEEKQMEEVTIGAKPKKSVQKTRRISRAPVDSEDSEPEQKEEEQMEEVTNGAKPKKEKKKREKSQRHREKKEKHSRAVEKLKKKGRVSELNEVSVVSS